MAKNKKILLIMLVISVIGYFALNSNLIARNYIIQTTKISNNIRIIFISDLHSCSYGENQEPLLNLIHEKKPDIILLGGDIADDILPHKNTETILKNLSKSFPCYYVSGNHEYWSGHISDIKDMFRKYNVTVLEGDSITVELNGEKLNICGIDDYEVGAFEYNKQLKSATNNCDTNLYTILLAHRPEHIEKYLEYDFDLILSGHAHGGQWRIPFLLNGLYSPNQGFFPKYAGGKYNFGSTEFIVNRGLAKESTKIPRIFNPPEIVVIDLVNEKQF